MAEEYAIITDTDETFVTKRSATASEQGLMLGGTLVAATALELNRAADVSSRLVSATAATLAVTEAAHEGRTVVLNRAAGVTATLPAATGSGARYRFIVGTTASGGSYIIQVTGNDVMYGVALADDGDGEPANGWGTAVDSDTVTLNGGTTGGVKGDFVEFEDIAADSWHVRAFLINSGTEATPFSAAVA